MISNQRRLFHSAAAASSLLLWEELLRVLLELKTVGREVRKVAWNAARLSLKRIQVRDRVCCHEHKGDHGNEKEVSARISVIWRYLEGIRKGFAG